MKTAMTELQHLIKSLEKKAEKSKNAKRHAIAFFAIMRP
jgi:hypothetical protein